MQTHTVPHFYYICGTTRVTAINIRQNDYQKKKKKKQV